MLYTIIKTKIPGTHKITNITVAILMLKSDNMPVTTIQAVYTPHIKPLARLYDGISVISSGLTVLPDQKCIGSLRLNAQRAIAPKINEHSQHEAVNIIFANSIITFSLPSLENMSVCAFLLRNHSWSLICSLTIRLYRCLNQIIALKHFYSYFSEDRGVFYEVFLQI